jgi:hypothetical protein
MISKAVTQYAQQHGFTFYVNGMGYRNLAQITDLNGKHISWCSNNSARAKQAIELIIKQTTINAKSNDAIVTESEQALADLLPPVVTIDATVAEQAYQELQPMTAWEQRRAAHLAINSTFGSDDSSTYSRADNYGDDAFAFSNRYGCGALI